VPSEGLSFANPAVPLLWTAMVIKQYRLEADAGRAIGAIMSRFFR